MTLDDLRALAAVLGGCTPAAHVIGEAPGVVRGWLLRGEPVSPSAAAHLARLTVVEVTPTRVRLEVALPTRGRPGRPRKAAAP